MAEMPKITVELAFGKIAADQLAAREVLIVQLGEALQEAKFALFVSDMTIKDRADQASRLALAAFHKFQGA